MPRKHRIYEKDFPQEAVNLLLSSGRALKRIAAELEISANPLRTWRDQALGKGRGAEAASPQAKGRSAAPLADAAGEPSGARQPAVGSPQGGAEATANPPPATRGRIPPPPA